MGECLLLLTRAAPGPVGLLFSTPVRVGSPGLFCMVPLPFRLFFRRLCKDVSIYAVPLLLGGDLCRSVGDQPPVPTPRGDPAGLGNLSADQPLVALLYSFSLTPSPLLLFSVSFLFFCNTRWGRVASTSCRSESSNISLVVLDENRSFDK